MKRSTLSALSAGSLAVGLVAALRHYGSADTDTSQAHPGPVDPASEHRISVPARPPGSIATASDAAGINEALRLSRMPSGLSREDAITTFAAGLKSPAACATLATNATLYGHSIAGAALRRWVELDAPGAIATYALGIRTRELRTSNLDWMFREYAEQDPRAALQLARTLPNSAEGDRQVSIAATLPPLSRIDPAGASAALRELPAGIAVASAAEIYAERARTEPAGVAFADAGRLSGAARSAGQQAVLRVAAETAPQSAVDLWKATDSGGLRNELTRALANGFAEAGVDPKEVASWVFTNAQERGAESVRAEVLGQLAEGNPAAANELLASRSIGEQDDMKMALAGTIDPGTALEFARTISRPDQRESALATIASRLGSQDPEALLSLFEKDPEFAKSAVPAVVDALAYADMDRAATVVRQLPESLRDGAATRLADQITDTSPARAMEMASELVSDPDSRRRAVAAAYAAGMTDSLGGPALALPASLSGDEQDRVLQTASALMAYRNPDAAWKAALTIVDPNLQANALQEALRGIAATVSMAAAEDRLATSRLPSDVITEIRGQLGTGTP